MAPDDAALLLLLAEDWARLTARQAPGARSSPALHATLTRLAELAPEAAAGCPALLAHLGPSVSHRVKVLAVASAVSELDRRAAAAASWLTTAEAAASLGITPHGVRDLLRRGRLTGRRDPVAGGPAWRVSAASVRARRLESAAA
jgi:hypothetical protein